MASSSVEKSTLLSKLQPFIFGGTAGMFATCCIQPIDMVKVQIQFSANPGLQPFRVARTMIQKHGFLSLYNGLSAGLMRQAMYTTTRLGIFYTLLDEIKRRKGTVSLQERASAGLLGGAIGAIVGNPCDLSLIRIQADTVASSAERKGYTNVFNTIIRIVKEEGVWTLWRGSLPTVCRAMALNLGMLATYDEAKEYMLQIFGPGKVTNLSSSAFAGFFASLFSLPFDFLKTRIQKQKTEPGKNPMGVYCMAVHVTRSEGLLAFYKGFGTYYCRIAPHAMITLLTVEILRYFSSRQANAIPIKQKKIGE